MNLTTPFSISSLESRISLSKFDYLVIVKVIKIVLAKNIFPKIAVSDNKSKS